MTEETNLTSVRTMRVLALVWAVSIVLIGILPLRNFVGHSHWEYIQWVPTLDNLRSPRYLFDMATNTILFIPLGYFVTRSIGNPPARGLHIAVGSAAVISSSIEFYQVYCHNRHPSPVDIATDILGGLLGAVVVVVIGRMRQTPPADRVTPIPPAHTLVP